MNISFIAQNTDWTEGMKEAVRSKIAAPLLRSMKSEEFEMAVHLTSEAAASVAPTYVMWVVLQTFDGRNNEVVRRHGGEFLSLVNEVSSRMRPRVRDKACARRKFLANLNPFRMRPVSSDCARANC